MKEQNFTDKELNEFRDLVEAGESLNQLERIRSRLEHLVMCDLVKRLDIKAGVMEMGEKIAWGSDTALMREAARKIEDMQGKIDHLELLVKKYESDDWVDA